MNFKIIFPTGYNVTNPDNDNIDVNIVLENRKVFFATIFTLENIKQLLNQENENYFWATDMITAKNISKQEIKKIITEIVNEEYIEQICSEIGNIEDVFPDSEIQYIDIEDMA
jgi:flagellar biosynthesis component FlhA